MPDAARGMLGTETKVTYKVELCPLQDYVVALTLCTLDMTLSKQICSVSDLGDVILGPASKMAGVLTQGMNLDIGTHRGKIV